MTEVLTAGSLGGLEVTPVSDTMANINMLIYGDPGVGKTVLAGSASMVEAMSPVLFIDIEGGTYSIRDRFPSVQTVRVQTWKDMQRVYNELYAGTHGFKTIVLDSLTEIQKFSMYNIMQQVIKENADRDPDIPAMRDWGKNIEQIRKLVRGFRDLPIHTIFTALAKYDKDAKTGVTKTSPYLSGKLSAEVGGFLDIVVFMYRKVVDGQVQRLLLTQGTEQQTAKDRSDRLPQVVQNPTMQIMYDYIFNVGNVGNVGNLGDTQS